jgi:hypothetical protein
LLKNIKRQFIGMENADKLLKKRQFLTISDNRSMKDKFCCFCGIACFSLFNYFECELFDAANKYCSLPTWNIVHFYFFPLLGNSSLFTKIILCLPRKLFDGASEISRIILGCALKLFLVVYENYSLPLRE